MTWTPLTRMMAGYSENQAANSPTPSDADQAEAATVERYAAEMLAVADAHGEPHARMLHAYNEGSGDLPPGFAAEGGPASDGPRKAPRSRNWPNWRPRSGSPNAPRTA